MLSLSRLEKKLIFNLIHFIMGCDIHMFTERKMSINNNPKWVNIDNWQLNPYFDKDDADGYEREYHIKELYGSRNYALFAVLAGVRNYSGQKIISEPRGIPDDVSEVVKKEYDLWDSDGHSHSWFTLQELKDFLVQNPQHEESGLITAAEAELFDSDGTLPTIWCQGSSDETMVHRVWKKESVLKQLIDAFEGKKKREFYEYEIGEDFDENVRIVFWFDN